MRIPRSAGHFPFLSDVKARHDSMVGLVETVMTADNLRLGGMRFGTSRRSPR